MVNRKFRAQKRVVSLILSLVFCFSLVLGPLCAEDPGPIVKNLSLDRQMPDTIRAIMAADATRVNSNIPFQVKWFEPDLNPNKFFRTSPQKLFAILLRQNFLFPNSFDFVEFSKSLGVRAMGDVTEFFINLYDSPAITPDLISHELTLQSVFERIVEGKKLLAEFLNFGKNLNERVETVEKGLRGISGLLYLNAKLLAFGGRFVNLNTAKFISIWSTKLLAYSKRMKDVSAAFEKFIYVGNLREIGGNIADPELAAVFNKPFPHGGWERAKFVANTVGVALNIIEAGVSIYNLGGLDPWEYNSLNAWRDYGTILILGVGTAIAFLCPPAGLAIGAVLAVISVGDMLWNSICDAVESKIEEGRKWAATYQDSLKYLEFNDRKFKDFRFFFLNRVLRGQSGNSSSYISRMAGDSSNEAASMDIVKNLKSIREKVDLEVDPGDSKWNTSIIKNKKAALDRILTAVASKAAVSSYYYARMSQDGTDLLLGANPDDLYKMWEIKADVTSHQISIDEAQEAEGRAIKERKKNYEEGGFWASAWQATKDAYGRTIGKIVKNAGNELHQISEIAKGMHDEIAGTTWAWTTQLDRFNSYLDTYGNKPWCLCPDFYLLLRYHYFIKSLPRSARLYPQYKIIRQRIEQNAFNYYPLIEAWLSSIQTVRLTRKGFLDQTAQDDPEVAPDAENGTAPEEEEAPSQDETASPDLVANKSLRNQAARDATSVSIDFRSAETLLPDYQKKLVEHAAKVDMFLLATEELVAVEKTLKGISKSIADEFPQAPPAYAVGKSRDYSSFDQSSADGFYDNQDGFLFLELTIEYVRNNFGVTIEKYHDTLEEAFFSFCNPILTETTPESRKINVTKFGKLLHASIMEDSRNPGIPNVTELMTDPDSGNAPPANPILLSEFLNNEFFRKRLEEFFFRAGMRLSHKLTRLTLLADQVSRKHQLFLFLKDYANDRLLLLTEPGKNYKAWLKKGGNGDQFIEFLELGKFDDSRSWENIFNFDDPPVKTFRDRCEAIVSHCDSITRKCEEFRLKVIFPEFAKTCWLLAGLKNLYTSWKTTAESDYSITLNLRSYPDSLAGIEPLVENVDLGLSTYVEDDVFPAMFTNPAPPFLEAAYCFTCNAELPSANSNLADSFAVMNPDPKLNLMQLTGGALKKLAEKTPED